MLAKTAIAWSTNLTVFVSMKGDGVEWHNYALDGCALTHEELPPRFQSAQWVPGVGFRAAVWSKANRANRVEATTDFVRWDTVTNALNQTGAWQFADPAGMGQKFYRARLLP